MLLIHDDVDVSQLFTPMDGVMVINVPMVELLPPLERELVVEFIIADQQVDPAGSAAEAIEALVRGVHAVESLAGSASLYATAWRKFITFNTSCNIDILWESFRVADETRIFSEWVTTTVHRNGWTSDGNATALGRAHSHGMVISREAGGGVRRDPITDQFVAPTGDEARQYVSRSGAGTPPAAPAPSTSASPPAHWAPDPAGAFELRYWDGTTWTGHVSTGGTTGWAPL